MLRREFLGGLGFAAATWPVAARAQQPMPVIGYLSSGSAQGFASRLEAFRSGLQETGYRESAHDQREQVGLIGGERCPKSKRYQD